MKKKRLFLGLVVSLYVMGGFLVLRAAGEYPLEALHRCTDNLDGFDRWFRSWVPLRLVQLDRRLYRFVQGVRFHRENLKLLESTWPTVSQKTHVAENAIDGCEAYLQRYKRRAYYFMAFSACVLVLALLLTALFLLNTFLPPRQGSRRRKVHVQQTAVSPDPEDRVSDRAGSKPST